MLTVVGETLMEEASDTGSIPVSSIEGKLWTRICFQSFLNMKGSLIIDADICI